MPTASPAGVVPTRRQTEANRRNVAWLGALLTIAAASGLAASGLARSMGPHWAVALVHLAILSAFVAALFTIWTAGATALTLLGARRLRLLLPHVPPEVRAMNRLTVRLSLANSARFAPALFATINFRVTSREHVLWVVPQVAPSIGAGGQTALGWEVLVRKRGPLAIGPFVVRAAFPGSLVRAGLVFDYHREILTLPTEYELTADVLQVLAGRRQAAGRNSPAPGGMGELTGVREWRPGDPVRMIHRALSLRAPRFPRQLVVRECENPATGDVLVVLDNAVPPDDRLAAQLSWRLEKGVCFALALCKLLVAHKYRVQFLTHSDQKRRIKVSLGGRRSEIGVLERTLSRLVPASRRAELWTLPDPETLRTGSMIAYVSLRRHAEEDHHPRLSVVTITPDSIGPLTRHVVMP